MSIIIRKKDSGEVFDTPLNMELEINNTSPVFNNLGTKSVSTGLPRTEHNIRLLGYSNRLDIANKPLSKIAVGITFGSFHRDGVLYLSSANNTEYSFGITLAFDEGIMYEEMNDLLLTELSGLTVIEKPVPELIAYMNQLFHGERSQHELSVFTISLKGEDVTMIGGNEATQPYHKYYPYINFTSDHDTYLSDKTFTNIVYKGEVKQIDVPYGYGITPFVRVWRILEFIFEHFGYKVNTNPFKTHYQLNGLCALNNTVDALVLGRLKYSQLLPPVTIADFLDSLYARFGLKVFFDSNKNEVNLYLIKDIIQSSISKSINVASLLDIEYSKPKQLKLTASKNLEGSETETETYEEFLSKYNDTIDTVTSIDELNVGGIFFIETEGLFYQVSTRFNKQKLISSIHFDWNKKEEDLETEEISGKDECLTLVNQEGSIYYAVGPCLQNSVMTINAENNDMFSGENKLAFAYDLGEKYTIDGNGYKIYQGYNFGSIFPYIYQRYKSPVRYQDKQGNLFEYALTFIGFDGAFNRFFKEYDAFLRHSNHLVKFKSHLPVRQLSDPDLSVKINVDGQPLLIDKLNHTLSNNYTTASIEARTTKLYLPYNLEKEQYLPVPRSIYYYWKESNNEAQSANAARDAKEIELKKNGESIPNYTFEGLTIQRYYSERPSNDLDFWFLPPSQLDYIVKNKIGEMTYGLKVVCIYRYWAFGKFNSDSLTISTTYNIWFEAERRDL